MRQYTKQNNWQQEGVYAYMHIFSSLYARTYVCVCLCIAHITQSSKVAGDREMCMCLCMHIHMRSSRYVAYESLVYTCIICIHVIFGLMPIVQIYACMQDMYICVHARV